MISSQCELFLKFQLLLVLAICSAIFTLGICLETRLQKPYYIPFICMHFLCLVFFFHLKDFGGKNSMWELTKTVIFAVVKKELMEPSTGNLELARSITRASPYLRPRSPYHCSCCERSPLSTFVPSDVRHATALA